MKKILDVSLRLMGYTRVYDLETGHDLTVQYHFMKFISQINLPIKFDISYPYVGVCSYVDNRYVRFVKYDCKLSSVVQNISPEKNLTMGRYMDIKKIELIKNTETIDVTDCKINLYDVGGYTRIVDVVKFYATMTGLSIDDEKYSIRIVREKFDQDLLEFITSSEEVFIE
jgi:hypothetical protein